MLPEGRGKNLINRYIVEKRRKIYSVFIVKGCILNFMKINIALNKL